MRIVTEKETKNVDYTLIPPERRELWVTPSVETFLKKFSMTEKHRKLTDEIAKALDGRAPKDGCIRISAAEGFLLFIIDPATPEGRERVVAWHGPSDGGIFFKDSIVRNTTRWDGPLM